MKRLLIVDDAMIVQFMLSQIISEAGYDVIGSAKDGIEAIEIVKNEKPDIVILDLGIPKLAGLEVLKQIKAMSPNTRVIIYSALRLKPKIDEAIKLGADAYLVKPVDRSKLLATLSGASYEAA